MVDQAEAFFDVNLFCPDLFSESIPSFGSLEPSTETRLSRLFEENYPHCGRLEKITRCGEIGINSANFRIKANESSYILKFVSKLSSRQRSECHLSFPFLSLDTPEEY